MSNVKDFLKRKDIVITPQRYLIEALGAMAQGLFASLLIGTIIKTLGQQTGLETLVDLGGYATAMSGPAMAVAIGWALHCPPLVLFSLVTVGYSSNALGGAGGPLAVLIIAIVAVSSLISFFQQEKSGEAAKKLKSVISSQIDVIRGGESRETLAQTGEERRMGDDVLIHRCPVKPGDFVVLTIGVIITALAATCLIAHRHHD